MLKQELNQITTGDTAQATAPEKMTRVEVSIESLSESEKTEFSPIDEAAPEQSSFAPGEESDSDANSTIYTTTNMSEALPKNQLPRPALTVKEASIVLGMSVPSLERCIEGRWGNRLPSGWKARKIALSGDLANSPEWRIIPPAGFALKRKNSIEDSSAHEKRLLEAEAKLEELEKKEKQLSNSAESSQEYSQESTQESSQDIAPESDDALQNNPTQSKEKSIFSMAIEKLLLKAGERAKHELGKVTEAARAQVQSESENELIHATAYSTDFDNNPTIIIDRSEEVEKLLRELCETQKELAEERRQHLEDMRLLAEMQNSMRLLEINASRTAELKSELETTRDALSEHKSQYRQFLALPWWKRIFRKLP